MKVSPWKLVLGCCVMASGWVHGQTLYWGGGSVDIVGPAVPSYGAGTWDNGVTPATPIQNWATDAAGTSYQAWDNGGSAIANFQWIGANYNVDIPDSNNLSVGGITITPSASPTGKSVTLNRTSGGVTMTFADGAVLDVDGADSSFVLNIASQVALNASGDLVKSGAGTLSFTRFQTNLTIGAGNTLDIQEGVFQYGGNRALQASGATVDIAAGATLRDTTNADTSDFVGGFKRIGALTGEGTYEGRSGPLGDTKPNTILEIGGGDLSSTFDGDIIDNGPSSNPLAITKVGTGTFELAGTGSYSNVTTVSEGTFLLSGLYTGDGSLVIGNGAFDLSGTGFFGDLTFTGTGVATLFGTGQLNVLQSNYSIAEANTDISLGNLLGDAGQGLLVSTFDDGSNFYTQITMVPEPTTLAFLGLAALLGIALMARQRSLRAKA